MSTALFITAAWLWFVLVMQDGARGSLRIGLILSIVIPLGLACLIVEHIAGLLRELITATSAFIMTIGED